MLKDQIHQKEKQIEGKLYTYQAQSPKTLPKPLMAKPKYLLEEQKRKLR